MQSLRQIKISVSLYQNIKLYCQTHHISMKFFYKKMLAWYINQYQNDPNVIYQASLKEGKALSLWIEQSQLYVIQTLSHKNKISDARVIYTALMLYIEYLNKQSNQNLAPIFYF